ncbi:FecCD family ABC transporter permease [Kocuria sp.]|uniref:FecCD family ABC transporter permease n=1 Tax=Kocuria sp. TaxID=1871328 RepID=UPI0026E0DE15|nr:iron ABC transporter permease [Kocuria sp.]MDO5618414.1 iron ABC transporter permease [Kocuria sp.]
MLQTLSGTSRARTQVITLGILVLALVLCCAVSLFIGSRGVEPSAVWQALWHPEQAQTEITVLVHELRIPRIVIGVAVGAALGLAGALTQGHTRNPLADPGLLGVTSGAALAIVAAAFFLGVTSPGVQVWFAFGGAVIGATLVFAISALGGSATNPLTLILAGSALTAFLTAMTTMLVLSDRGALNVQRYWQAGTVAGRDLSVLTDVLPYLVVGTVIALLSGRTLTLLGLGDSAARSLGARPGLARWSGFVAIVVLAGAATAVAGPIGFVGLVVPHIARLIGGPDYRWVIPVSGLLGAILVVVADTVGRIIAAPSEVQASIMLAFIGAPVFILLVRRRLPVGP